MVHLTPETDQSDIDGRDGRVHARLIQEAIDEVAEAGGGSVRLGAGEWLCSTIRLRSHVELHLERGCRLKADGEVSHYSAARHDWSEKVDDCLSLLVAEDCEDVALTGPGKIDGSCLEFWEPCKDEADRPYGIFRFVPRRDRPVRPTTLVQLAHCRDVVVDGVTLIDSPSWTLHVFDCDHASVRNVTIRNNRLIPYTDGIGINSSRDVRVAHCDVDTGDDAIIVKATRADLSCERVTVTNCVASSNCSAFGLGADAAGTIRDVLFSHCVASRSLRMIQVEQWYPGMMERAVFSNITGRTYPDEGISCERAIYVDIQQWERGGDGDAESSPLGSIRDLVFHSIMCETRGRIVLTAQDGSCIENVSLDNVHLRVSDIEDPAVVVPEARSLQLSNFNPKTRAARAAVVADNVKGLLMRDVRVSWPEEAQVPMSAVCLRRCSSVRLESPGLTSSSADVPFEAECEEGE